MNIFSKKTIFISALLLAMVFLGACEKKLDYRDRVPPEVGIFQTCGLSYLPCCETDPSCAFGVCCNDPNDKKRNYCAEDCSCGDDEEFCCEGNLCNDGNVCRFGNCHKCGEVGEMCCELNVCKGDLLCHNDTCVECGLTGNPCCEDDCLYQDARDTSRNECKNGICSYCGSELGVSCMKEPYCNSGYLLNSNNCLVCGRDNLPCCYHDESGAYCLEGYSCNLGFCQKGSI